MTDEPKPIQRGKIDVVLPAIGLAIGAVPLRLSLREVREQSFVLSPNGEAISQTTHPTAFDYVAVPCGAIAIAIGLFGLVRGRSARRRGVIGLGVVAMALGLFQVVRGFLP